MRGVYERSVRACMKGVYARSVRECVRECMKGVYERSVRECVYIFVQHNVTAGSTTYDV
jgi:hypothetical protein